MADLYEPVRRHTAQQKRPRDGRLLWIVLACAVFLGGMVIWIHWLIHAQHRYSEFLAQLNYSTIEAYETGSLLCEDGSGPYAITGEHIYDVYRAMVAFGPGRERLFYPKGEGLILTYSDGAVLQLWQEAGERPLYVCYTASDGSRHRCELQDLTLEYLRRHCLAPGLN